MNALPTPSPEPAPAHPELRAAALQALCTPNIEQKVAWAGALYAQIASISIAPEATFQPGPLPGRPALPSLVDPGKVPKRAPHTREGLAALVHAIAHIEFNAINLALDAIWRFAHMPEAYYRDWLKVAAEEAQHFCLLQGQLQHLGHRYGDFPAHDGLWTMCERTAGDVLARMALVPRTLEARGLDASPLIQARLRKLGSTDALRTVEILDVILRDEIGHVAIGNQWYGWLCARARLDPVAHYRGLAREYKAPRLRPPFNHDARLRAGFSAAEIAELET
jgi:uncharacterized ferritin-like protein (DUF455 family)